MESNKSKLTTILLIIAIIIIVGLVVGMVFLVKNLKEEQQLNEENAGLNSGIEQVIENKENVEQTKVEETASDRMAKYAKNLKATYYELAKNEETTSLDGSQTLKVESLNKFYISDDDLKIPYGVSTMYVNKEFDLIIRNDDQTTSKVDSNVSGIYSIEVGQGGLLRVFVTHFDGHVSYLQTTQNSDGTFSIKSIVIEGVSNIINVMPCSKSHAAGYYFIDVDGNVIDPLSIQ